MKTNCILKIKVSYKNSIIFDGSYDEFPVVFGRSSECHLCLPHYSFISNQHGNISIEKGQILVSDLNSRNGIVVGGKRVLQQNIGKDGKFSAGDLKFSLHLEGQFDDPEKTLVSGEIQEKSPMARGLTGLNRVKSTHQYSFREVEEFKSTDDLTLQGTVLWNDDVFDIREFQKGDELVLGPNDMEPIYLPSFVERFRFGDYYNGKARLCISKKFKWQLYDSQGELSFEELTSEKSVNFDSKNYLIDLDFNRSFVIDLMPNIKMHICYVEQPRPLVKRTLIENREEFKSAISLSGLFHVILCIICFMLAPKSHAPRIEDVPERYARLLVEPPKQIFAPPPVPVATPPPPEPVVEAKPIPEKPKIVMKEKPKTKVKKVLAEHIVERHAEKAQPEKSAVQKPAPPAKSQEQIESENLLAQLSSLSSATIPQKNSEIKISQKNSSSKADGVQSKQLMKMVKSNGRNPAVNESLNSGSDALAKASQGGYQVGGVAGKAGKRNIAGSVVGVPKFEVAKGPQGLNEAEIQKVVNKHVSEIQQCYERALFQDASIVGRVQYEWNISPKGGVSDAAVKRSEVGNGDFLNDCVLKVIRKMKFPAAKNGEATNASIGFPFGRN